MLVTGCPPYVEADRYKATGPKVGWHGSQTEWRRFEGGVIAPGRFQAKWADEPLPWIDIHTRSVRVNVPIKNVLSLPVALWPDADDPEPVSSPAA